MAYFNIPKYKLVVSGSALLALLVSILLLVLISISINDTSDNFETIRVLEMLNGNEVYKKGPNKKSSSNYFIGPSSDIAQAIYHNRVKFGLMIIILLDPLAALSVNIFLAMAS